MNNKDWILKHCKFAQTNPRITQLDKVSSDSWDNLQASGSQETVEGWADSLIKVSGRFFWPQELAQEWNVPVEEAISTNFNEGIIPKAVQNLLPNFESKTEQKIKDLKVVPTEKQGWYNISFVLETKGELHKEPELI